MRSLILLVVAVAAVVAEGPLVDYHESVGIPLATRIREAELAAVKSGRIIGGQPAPLGAHPYLVGLVIQLQSGSISACGSSMLTNTRAITAGHCWLSFFTRSESFTLVFGSEFLFTGGVRVTTSDVETHSSWDELFAVEFDLAIIRFNHVATTNVIRPIALPSGALESNSFAGTWAQASGYGMISDSIPVQPNQVQSHVTLQVISNDVCRQSFGATITDRILCTSGAGIVGVCSSDSGGPLSVVVNNQRVLIGVISFGSFQCQAGMPSGFVRVTSHLPWIRQRL